MNLYNDPHIKAICDEAGLGSMTEIIGILGDRDEIDEATFAALTADDITRFYEQYIGPAIDSIEDELLGEDNWSDNR